MADAIPPGLVADLSVSTASLLLDEVRRVTLHLTPASAYAVLVERLVTSSERFAVLRPDGSGTLYGPGETLAPADLPVHPVALVTVDASGAAWYVPSHGVLYLYGLLAAAQ